MKRKTLVWIGLFVGVLALSPAQTRAADTVPAASQLNLSASAMRQQIDIQNNPRLHAGVQMASAAATANQLLPDEADLPADISSLKAAHIVVYKSERRMDLLDRQGRAIRSYQVSLGRNPVGDKERQGDNRTPEGRYTIDWRNPNSAFHLSMRISYPNKADIWQARQIGANPGGDIFIHGLPNGKGWKRWKYNKGRDWTNGCVAVYDDEMREIWDLVPDGTTIDIKP